MRPNDAFRNTGYTRWGQSCEDKTLYQSQEEAKRAAREYEHRVLFSEMNAYPCPQHNVWHIGHAHKRLRAYRAFVAHYLIILSLFRLEEGEGVT